MKRSGFQIMARLIGLVKPLAGFMILAIAMGLIGHLCAAFITVFGGYAILHVLHPEWSMGLGVLFGAVLIFALVRGFLRYAEQACNHFIAFKLLALIRDLSVKDHRTILISSHQLQQIQQICDRVGIFVRGKLIACGPIAELGRQIQGADNFVLEVAATPDDSGLEKLLGSLEDLRQLERKGDGWLLRSGRDLRGQVGRLLTENGYIIEQLHQRNGDLDEIYHKYFEKAGEQDDHIQEKRRAKRAGA